MEDIIIFTDGASRGNPGPGGWGAVSIYPNGKSEIRVDELGGRDDMTTNNKMELTAAIKALEDFDNYYADMSQYRFIIHTDSSYVINGITKWVHGWVKKNWITTEKKDVLNKELWQALMKAVEGKNLSWKYVGGHVGIAGNERCDEIATGLADKNEIKLYSGSLSSYGIPDVLNINFDDAKKASKKTDKSRSNAKAYSYLSMVDGKIMTHTKWAECEARVKGVKGAKYKKALSKSEEGEIIKEWER